MKTARVWDGAGFVESTPINGSLPSAPLGQVQVNTSKQSTNSELAVATTPTSSRQASLDVLPISPVIFVQPNGSSAIKALSPAPTVVESVTPSATALSQKLSAPLKMQVVVKTAKLVELSEGQFYLQTQFQALVRNEATGQLIVNDICNVKDGKAYPLSYFQQKFAIALNRHLESHANRCASKHSSVIEALKV